MRTQQVLATFIVLALIIGLMPVAATSAQAPTQGSSPYIRQISSSTVASFPTGGSAGPDVNGAQSPEIAPDFGPEANAATGAAPQSTNGVQNNVKHPLINRSMSREHDDRRGDNHHGPLTSPIVKSSSIAGSNPELNLSFDGLNHRNQRLANGGNQFSLEPPDQGLCAGNGFVMETINDVLRVYDTSGNPLSGVIDLNSFYGYPPAINRTTGVSGPFMTDPSCYFDSATQRWFHVDLTLDTDPATGDFLGTSHLDLAVSTSSSPLGSWIIYRIPTMDDGTAGTPDHHCPLDDAGNGHGPCFGDYPHIGADKYGFYITTNEYAFFPTNTFMSAQVYALSKAQLAANASSVTLVQFDTTGAVHSRNGAQPGFTVWPAEANDGKYADDKRGTEFFLSSNAGEEANGVPGGSFSNELVVWALTNSRSLSSASPDVDLSNKVVRSETYGIPPKSDQKAGSIPLGDCLNDNTLFGGGIGCWALFFNVPATLPPAWQPEVESHPDSNDTRMQQVWYANGKLWGSLDTIVTVGGQDKAGIAYFAVNADVEDHGHLSADIDQQGYVAVANNNVTYPALAILPNGKGVMAFTLVGQDYYPSAGYVSVGKKDTGDVHVAAAGLGPTDGFTSYKAFVGDPPRTRWGDYGAAVVVGNDIWIASEYIAQTCTLAQYLTSPIGSCGGTRTSLANWGTRISKVTP